MICEVLVDNFYDKYIKFPKGQELRRIMDGFEEMTNIPYMWGAIDGSHIVLTKKPTLQQEPDDYYNRHHFHSVILQGICDYQLRFLDVCVCSPGGTHDARHRRMSFIWQRMQDGEHPNKLQFQLADKQKTVVHPYLLGDFAYLIQVGLLKCYMAKGTSTK